MALPSTLYRFYINLSDTDRDVYEELELRVPMHPSESIPSLLSRVIAYGLNFQEGIEFTQGISNPDLPSLWVKDLTGTILTWIDVGTPSARRLHKASKSARSVRVYTYRDPAILAREVSGAQIHRLQDIEVFSVDPNFLAQLGNTLERQNKWDLLHSEGELTVVAKGESYQCELLKSCLKNNAGA